MSAVIREYRPQDLGQVLSLWDRVGSDHHDGLSVDLAVDLIASDQGVAVVAEMDAKIVGLALAGISSVVASIYRISTDPQGPGDEWMPRLIEDLESRLATRGARRLLMFALVDDRVREHLERRGYTAPERAAHLELDLPETVASPSLLVELGGRMIEPGLWNQLKGMDDPKEVIEKRVILPLEKPDLASRHAVAPPRAVVLFGPPGTGKTTFAKGIASRLGWPFIEIHPAELAGEGAEKQGMLLAKAFDGILELPSAVVFVDEVEDLAASREEERKVNPGVANEFLKQIPRFRDTPLHLLACATNWVSKLDSAFLRPGRFDYVLPVGPPDAAARRGVWQRYVGEITDEEVDIDALVDESDLFTPADIEFAARKAAQRAFEREHFEGAGGRAITPDFLKAIKLTRPSLSEDIVDAFQKDTRKFARY